MPARHPAQGQSNGWYVWRGDAIPRAQDDFFVPCHIEHLPDHLLEVVPYLALAPGYEDVWHDEGFLDV